MNIVMHAKLKILSESLLCSEDKTLNVKRLLRFSKVFNNAHVLVK